MTPRMPERVNTRCIPKMVTWDEFAWMVNTHDGEYPDDAPAPIYSKEEGTRVFREVVRGK